MSQDNERAALAAIDAIIDDFGHHRRDEYFAGFAPDATFVFHNSPARLESRADYEKLWAEWERESGFSVQSCSSTGRRIQLFGTIAVFSHDVETVLRVNGVLEIQQERESIIMEERDGVWLCIHEHLSGLD